MFAIIGIPGESIHRYRWFPRTARKEAEKWLEQEFTSIRRLSPQTVPVTRILSDREAARVRWQDGTRVYRKKSD